MNVQAADYISKSGLTLTDRNKTAPGGKPRTWGMLFTVTDDPTPGNNVTWYLKYNQASTSLTDNNNWVTAASEFGGGGSSYTFSNGLTETAGNVTLGGAVTSYTLTADNVIAEHSTTLTQTTAGISVVYDYYNEFQLYFSSLSVGSQGVDLKSGNNGTFLSSRIYMPVIDGSVRITAQNDSSAPFIEAPYVLINADVFSVPSIAAASGQTYAVVVNDAGEFSSQAISGGIGGSTGSVDNALLRADGAGGATLQSSGVVIDDSANITLGGVSLAGDRYIIAQNDASNASLSLISEDYIGLVYGTQTTKFFQTTVGSNTVHAMALGNNGSGPPVGGLITINNDGTGTAGGGNLWMVAGTNASGVNKGGDIYLKGGDGVGGGIGGNIAFGVTSISNFQGMGGGLVYTNATTLPGAGIANGVAFYAKDVGTSSELFTMSESGAEVNISGLLTPVIESGATFTINETHRNKIVNCTFNGAITVTVDAGLPLGFNTVLLVSDAAGTLSLTTSGGATVNGTTTISSQFGTLSLVHYQATDVYLSK